MTRRTLQLAIIALALALATEMRADDGKTYRWVGQDGRVYSGPNPPPNGRGVIESSAPATGPAPAKPVAPAGGVHPVTSPLPQALPAAPAQVEKTCGYYEDYVSSWRREKTSVDAAEQRLDALNSNTDDYVEQNDSWHNAQVDGAELRLKAAQERLDRAESTAMQAGVPQKCLEN
jgi:hypothetical protein